MLCLDSKRFSIHKGIFSLPSNLNVHKNDLIAFYIQSFFLIYRIKDIRILNKLLSIHVEYDSKKEIDHRLGQLITKLEEPMDINDASFQNILDLSSNLRVPPLQIHFKKKARQYFRILIIDPVRNLSVEKYMNWDEYLKLEIEFQEAKERADQSIRNTGFSGAQSSIEWIKKTAGRLLEKTSISLEKLFPVDFDNRAIDVIMSSPGWVPPLDVLLSPHFVRYLLPGKEAKSNEKYSSVFFYSDLLKGGRIETLKLSEIVDAVSHTEVFPDSHYLSKKPELAETGILHFTGHGAIREGMSFLKIGDMEIQDIPVSEKLKLAFLHCCHTGSFSEGIIGNLIENGAQSVIACPLEMPDGELPSQNQSVEAFYKVMPLVGPELAFRYISTVDRNFSLYYRYFSPYRDKI